MLDAHAHVMQVKLCKANTRGVTAVISLGLVGAESKYFYDDVRSFPRCRKLVAVFVALDVAKD